MALALARSRSDAACSLIWFTSTDASLLAWISHKIYHARTSPLAVARDLSACRTYQPFGGSFTHAAPAFRLIRWGYIVTVAYVTLTWRCCWVSPADVPSLTCGGVPIPGALFLAMPPHVPAWSSRATRS